MPHEVKGHTASHLKALRYGKYETRGLSCGSTSSICQEILKSDNLLHKMKTSVGICFYNTGGA